MATAKKATPARRPLTSTFTSVPVKPETLRRLRSYKVAGMNYDDVLNDLMDERPTEAFWEEHRRRLAEEESIPWDEARERLDLPRPTPSKRPKAR